MRMQVWSLALLSGLRIQRRPQLQLQFDPYPGNLYATGAAIKRKKIYIYIDFNIYVYIDFNIWELCITEQLTKWLYMSFNLTTKLWSKDYDTFYSRDKLTEAQKDSMTWSGENSHSVAKTWPFPASLDSKFHALLIHFFKNNYHRTPFKIANLNMVQDTKIQQPSN